MQWASENRKDTCRISTNWWIVLIDMWQQFWNFDQISHSLYKYFRNGAGLNLLCRQVRFPRNAVSFSLSTCLSSTPSSSSWTKRQQESPPFSNFGASSVATNFSPSFFATFSTSISNPIQQNIPNYPRHRLGRIELAELRHSGKSIWLIFGPNFQAKSPIFADHGRQCDQDFR